jgi:hypothetical protein
MHNSDPPPQGVENRNILLWFKCVLTALHVNCMILFDRVPNKLLLSESAVSCLLRVRSVSFTSRAKGCIKIVHHSCLVSLSHKVGVLLEQEKNETMPRYILNEVETRHHLILIRLYFILTILITEDDHSHIVLIGLKL